MNTTTKLNGIELLLKKAIVDDADENIQFLKNISGSFFGHHFYQLFTTIFRISFLQIH